MARLCQIVGSASAGCAPECLDQVHGILNHVKMSFNYVSVQAPVRRSIDIRVVAKAKIVH